MKQLFISVLLFSLFTYAKDVKKVSSNSKIQIDSIEYKIFDRQKNKFIDDNNQSDPYGMHGDVLILVKLSKMGEKEINLKVTATTPKTFDEARGETSASGQTSTKHVFGPDAPFTSVTVPFIFNFECNTMTIAAEVEGEKIKKEIKASLFCAE